MELVGGLQDIEPSKAVGTSPNVSSALGRNMPTTATGQEGLANRPTSIKKKVIS